MFAKKKNAMHFTVNGKLTNKKILTHDKYTKKIHNPQNHSLKSEEKIPVNLTTNRYHNN